MDSSGVFSFRILTVLLAVFTDFACSSLIFNEVFSSHGRTLLQSSKDCPISFEFKNYSVFTTQCKAPNYPPKQCCDALNQFACPYADYIDDGSTNCASRMFSYINSIGKYPGGLFGSYCKGDLIGLISCVGVNSTNSTQNSGSELNSNFKNFGDLSKIVVGLMGIFGFFILVS